MDYTATMTWGGEVNQTCTAMERLVVGQWVAAGQARGGTLLEVTVRARTAAATALLALLLDEPPTRIDGASEGARFQVVVGSGWARVEVEAGEPVSERWTRSVWPAVCAATAAGEAVTARRVKAQADANGGG